MFDWDALGTPHRHEGEFQLPDGRWARWRVLGQESAHDPGAFTWDDVDRLERIVAGQEVDDLVDWAAFLSERIESRLQPREEP